MGLTGSAVCVGGVEQRRPWINKRHKETNAETGNRNTSRTSDR